ncbi:response regulator transcription factor [Actinoplanes sp. L3-i22]|uniref:response regulator n=1 Tax=Actinoplanes sp. L3-i22 TaxID=2836373 RepID=UPI001C74BEFD|nr:response regulator transcription factor [Actinoplanes sp. L3-i22]BCY05951.1 DNA-binding response regulator [Actinoplanes sp. L3-i22]
MTVTVLLVDDQPLLSLGFRLVLEAQPDITVVGEAGDGAQAIRMTRALRPDVVLMDVRMPVLDGIEATRRIVADGNPARILVLTTFDLDEYVYAALRAGASGFLLKDVPPADLISAIHAVAGGHAAVAPAVTRRLLDAFVPHLPVTGPTSPKTDRLTEREREVLVLVGRGRSNGEIADELHLSEATVKAHVGRLLGKLELRDRVQIVVYAHENRLV